LDSKENFPRLVTFSSREFIFSPKNTMIKEMSTVLLVLFNNRERKKEIDARIIDCKIVNRKTQLYSMIKPFIIIVLIITPIINRI